MSLCVCKKKEKSSVLEKKKNKDTVYVNIRTWKRRIQLITGGKKENREETGTVIVSGKLMKNWLQALRSGTKTSTHARGRPSSVGGGGGGGEGVRRSSRRRDCKMLW